MLSSTFLAYCSHGIGKLGISEGNEETLKTLNFDCPEILSKISVFNLKNVCPCGKLNLRFHSRRHVRKHSGLFIAFSHVKNARHFWK